MKCYIIDKELVFFKVSQLLKLSDKDKAINTGLRKASTILKRYGRLSFRANHKSKTGNLLKSMGTRLKKRKLGSLTGFRRGLKGGNHAHLIDSGTKRRVTKKGYNRGKVNGSRFWRSTVDKSEQSVLNAFYDGIENAVNNLINKV